MSIATFLVVFCGTYLIWGEVLAFCIWIYQRARNARLRAAALGIVAAIGSEIVGKIAGHFWYDPQPFVEKGFTPLIAHAVDNGFPSDHALLAFSLASAVAIYDRQAGIWFWVIAAIIAAARVIAGVHHVIDVVSGALIAAIVTFILYKVLQRFFHEKGQTHT